jgi:hypothetical protein
MGWTDRSLTLLVFVQVADAPSRTAPGGKVKVAVAEPVSPQPTLMLPLGVTNGRLKYTMGGAIGALAGADALGAAADEELGGADVDAAIGAVGVRSAAGGGSSK